MTVLTVVHATAAATSLRDEIDPVQRPTGDARRTGASERRETAAVVASIVSEKSKGM